MASLRPRAAKAVTQFSFVDALVAGLYDGAFVASELTDVGDLGLGCGDALDGELVLLDGALYVCKGDGQVLPVSAEERIPFAEVVRFDPTHSQQIAGLTEKAFEDLVDALVPSDNLFYAIRVEGEFRRMAVREAVRQQKPYRGLAEAVKDQHENSVGETRGVMVGFKGPDVFQGLSVADYHLHYLDEARLFGGHVMDFELVSATLSIEAYSSFTLRLPEVESYLVAELDDMNADEAIRQAESS
jgi:acetolactate decarboxylase